MSNLEAVRKVVDMNCIQEFIVESRGISDKLEAVQNQSTPDDEKLIATYCILVSYGLLNPV